MPENSEKRSRFPIGKATLIITIFLGGLALVATGMSMSHNLVIRVGLLLIWWSIFVTSLLVYPPLTIRRKRQIRWSVYILILPTLIWLPEILNTPISKTLEVAERYGSQWQGEDEIAIPLPQPSLFNKTIPFLEKAFSPNALYQLTPAVKHEKDGVALVVQTFSLTMEQEGMIVDWNLTKHWEINGYPSPGWIAYVTNIPMPIPPGKRISVLSGLMFRATSARDYHVNYEITGKLDNGQGIRPIHGGFLLRLKKE